MPDYRHYEVADFAQDPAFRKWVLEASPSEKNYWEKWIADNPDRKEVIEQAKVLVLTVQQRFEDYLTEEEVNQEVNRLLSRMDTALLSDESEQLPQTRHFRFRAWQVAASVLLVLGLGWGYYQYHRLSDELATYHQLITKANGQLVERVNTTGHPLEVRLSDSSIVLLEKNSRISFSSQWTGDRREVYLTGEAFFTVTKNPQRPFIVYANETVTKVLGTSFRVSAFEKDQHVTVSVRTGRVSFYAAREFEKTRAKELTHVQGVVLMPNQRAVFSRQEGRLDKGIVEEPAVLEHQAAGKDLVFEDRPVTEVLDSLEHMYGIDIVYDEETLSHYPITTSFRDENLHQRLRVICQAIGAAYEVTDGQIVVNCINCKTN